MYRASVARGLTPGDIDYQLARMTFLGHMRKRMKSHVECKFSMRHRDDPVPLDETIHIYYATTSWWVRSAL